MHVRGWGRTLQRAPPSTITSTITPTHVYLAGGLILNSPTGSDRTGIPEFSSDDLPDYPQLYICLYALHLPCIFDIQVMTDPLVSKSNRGQQLFLETFSSQTHSPSSTALTHCPYMTTHLDSPAILSQLGPVSPNRLLILTHLLTWPSPCPFTALPSDDSSVTMTNLPCPL